MARVLRPGSNARWLQISTDVPEVRLDALKEIREVDQWEREVKFTDVSWEQEDHHFETFLYTLTRT